VTNEDEVVAIGSEVKRDCRPVGRKNRRHRGVGECRFGSFEPIAISHGDEESTLCGRFLPFFVIFERRRGPQKVVLTRALSEFVVNSVEHLATQRDSRAEILAERGIRGMSDVEIVRECHVPRR
jgi:hypothetical protein